jgi:hypothetical protein
MKRGSDAELRPCLGQGASLGEEAVLADSGRAGEVSAWVGRVRRLAFLSILRDFILLFLKLRPLNFHRATTVLRETPDPHYYSKRFAAKSPERAFLILHA